MSPLLARLDVLIASSTAPSTTDVDLRNYVELCLEARAGRAEGAYRINAARAEASEETRGRIVAHMRGLSLWAPLRDLIPEVRKSLAARGFTATDWQIVTEIRARRRKEREAKGMEGTESKLSPERRMLRSSQPTEERG